MKRINSGTLVVCLGAFSAMLAACGGGDGGGSGSSSGGTTTYTIGGALSGLTASGLVLTDGGQTVSPAANATSFTFPTAEGSGTSYSVTVSTQPSGLTCTVTNGSGTIASANVTSVQVACVANTYTIGGALSGLTASGLVLTDGGQTVSPAANATSFTFPTAEGSGTSYSVTVSTQPSGLTCTVTNGSGTIASANVTSVQVACVATTHSGQFIDAPTKGLTYSASPSGLTGTTDATGAFSFKTGDTVTFSLGVGNSSLLSIGSIAPSAPSSGTTELFVLALANGAQVAQVLQSLNHGSASAMDVSGITLPAADATNLNTYIATGGTVLPTGNSTDLQMLAQVQGDATVNGSSATSTTFVDSGGASVSATVAALNQTVSGLTASTTLALSTVLPGNILFHQGLNLDSSGNQFSYAFSYFNSSGTIVNVSANSSDTFSGTYSTSSNVLTVTNSSATDTITLSYIDGVEGLYTSSSSDSSTGVGTYNFLQSLTPSMIASKTLTITGALASSCGGVPLQFVIDASGSSFTVNCQGSSQQVGSGTIAAVSSLPGVVSLTDSSSGSVHELGLVAGGSLTSGSVAVVETVAPTGKSAVNGIFGLTSK